MNKDYVFHVNWAGRYKETYSVGILAQLDEAFYFIVKGKNRAEVAYKNGFNGIPGFEEETIYKSGELFDFFKNRIPDKEKNPCEVLAKTRGISMVDSFSLDTVSDIAVKKYKKIILEAYELAEDGKEIAQKEKSFPEEID